MMRQYRSIKKDLSDDTILFFRLGDFYEMFYEDAKETAPILDIALTKRNRMPMCGIPYHQLDSYLAKMIRAGRKVAICEQMEDPADAKGIVKREVTRVVTPGTVLEEHVLDADRNNYLAGLCRDGDTLGLAFLDLSTGEFWIEECDEPDAVHDTLQRMAPSECIVPEEQSGEADWVAALGVAGERVFSPQEDWIFERDVAVDTLTRHFGVASLEGFGCEGATAGVQAAGGVLYYVGNTLRRHTGHVRVLRVRNPASYLLLDEATVANLDLVPAARPGRDRATPNLLKVLDATRTPMGGRLLRHWLLRPARELEIIRGRHDAIDAFLADRSGLRDLREMLGGVRDLERLVARLGTGSANGRDLMALGASLAALDPLCAFVDNFAAGRIVTCRTAIDPLPEIADLVARAIENEPPITVKEGGVIRAGYHAELDELKDAATAGRKWLADFQLREQDRTGIKALKVRHNKVFGYYIEVTKANIHLVPDDYDRKQTLVNAERFITPELKEMENKILGAQDRAKELEYAIFQEVREEVVAKTRPIQATAAAVAEIAVLAALADRALGLRYVRPAMDDSAVIEIKDGRHPVVEQIPDADAFVPNDTTLDPLDHQVVILTGPNMAGKSTYIRQVALMVVMAHAGSFVPAAQARIGLVDRVFTRVGASDDLARGRSTFMVEMQETANILHNATPRSLVVLDEIGRGTSTFDGISIAWAVAEHLHNVAEVKAKTLFATHYHELTDLVVTLPGAKNFSVLVKESGDKIVFLRKIVEGPADKSYGIQVAKLAGLPDAVVNRAREILSNLEEGEFQEDKQPTIARKRKKSEDSDQLAFF